MTNNEENSQDEKIEENKEQENNNKLIEINEKEILENNLKENIDNNIVNNDNNINQEENNKNNDIDINNIIKDEKEKEKEILNDTNKKPIKNKKKKLKLKKSFIDVNEDDKISEKSNESSEKEEKKQDIITHITNFTNFEEELESKSDQLHKNTIYAKHNNTQNIDESIFKEKKSSLNKYSDNGTLNISNIGKNEEEESSNNIVNFLGLSKENTNKNRSTNNNMEIEDEEDEREYLNKKIKKKMIINKDNIEIIPEKKEEEDDYSEERRDSKLNIKKFTTRNSSVQIVQAKDIGRKTSIVLRQSLNKNKNKYSDSFSNLLINKIKKADKLKQYINNKRIKTRIDEKIEKIRNEIPHIKTKYEELIEEEKKKNEEEKDDEEVSDWFEGIFN